MQDNAVALVTGANQGIGVQTAKDHAMIGKAENIPVGAPTPLVSVSPVVLSKFREHHTQSVSRRIQHGVPRICPLPRYIFKRYLSPS
jgi:hypothetical protein